MAKLIALPRGREPTAARASLLIASGKLAQYQGDLDAARALFRECVEVGQHIGDSLATGVALSSLSDLARLSGNLALAQQLAEDGLEKLGRSSAEADLVAIFTKRLAHILYARGDLEGACTLLEPVLPVLQASGWTREIAECLLMLAARASAQADYARAKQSLEAAVQHWEQVNDRWGGAQAQAELARLQVDAGQPQRARDYLAASLEMCREVGDHRVTAMALDISAAVAVTAAQYETAVRLAVAAEALRESAGVPQFPREAVWIDSHLEAARRALGSKYDRVRRSSTVLSVDQAIEIALRPDTARVSHPLTAREREVAHLVARGLTDSQIAQQLVIGRRTVESHVSSILGKLGFASRAQVAAWAVGGERNP